MEPIQNSQIKCQSFAEEMQQIIVFLNDQEITKQFKEIQSSFSRKKVSIMLFGEKLPSQML